MSIKQIFDEIANESSTNQKMAILGKYKENKLLERVLYLANSKRIKYFIKQIPEYTINDRNMSLEWAIESLSDISNRSVTGDAAKGVLINILSSVSFDDAYIIRCIIEKDCKIGMGTSNINKVFPNLIEKVGYMGCKPYSIELINKLLKSGVCYSQEKMDGRFLNVIITHGEVEMESRQGEPTILDNPKFISELRKLKNCVLNAELTMGAGISRYESNGIISSLISIANKITLGKDITSEIKKFEGKHMMGYREALDLIVVTAWDELTLEEYYNRSSKRLYIDRLKSLGETLSGCDMIGVVETRFVSTIEAVMEHFNEIVSKNGEGTVVKSMTGLWVDSKPSTQIKVKKELNLDLKIVGFNYGTGKNSNLISSLNVESSDGLLKTSPTGITEDEMLYITQNQDKLMGQILEIKCSGISQDSSGNYSVLHPVYLKVRDDKTTANTLSECLEIDKSSSLI